MGERIYLPNSAQFDKMNENLALIAKAIGVQVDISTWEGIQKAVRAGIAPEIIPIGTQLLVNHSTYGNKPYVVVAHNHFKSAKNENAPTMTLMSLGTIGMIQYDSPEAFYYAHTELPSGTYHFTLTESYRSWEAGTYQFTLTKNLPAGGQLCIDGKADSAMAGMYVRAKTSRTSTNDLDIVVVSVGKEGTNLGEFGISLNDVNRVSDGSNNYKESAVRQFLNSSAPAGRVWEPQTIFDRPPSGFDSLDGFMKGLDGDFLAVVGEVIIPCAANNKYESPDSTISLGHKYTVIDKFYLASQREIFGTSVDMVEDDSVLLPYYKGATKVDFIKYAESGAPALWRTRTPYGSNSEKTHRVDLSGVRGGGYAVDKYGVAVVCNIV